MTFPLGALRSQYVGAVTFGGPMIFLEGLGSSDQTLIFQPGWREGPCRDAKVPLRQRRLVVVEAKPSPLGRALAR
jgi:hypothetical protein